MPNPVNDAIEGAKKTLANANTFTHSVTDPGSKGVTNAFEPKPLPKLNVPSYKQVHAARKEAAIPGGNENTSSEINARQAMGDSAKEPQ